MRRYRHVIINRAFLYETVTFVLVSMFGYVSDPTHTFVLTCPAGGPECCSGVVVVKIIRQRLADGYAGYTDGVDIYLDDRLDAVQEACTLMHELIHLEWGHVGHQPEAVEMLVRYEAARRLLPESRAGSCKGSTITEVAANLLVTRQVIMDRAASASDSLLSRGGCWECQLCPAVKMRAQELVGAA